MSDKKIKIGIIGYGNMGKAIAERIKSEYAVSVFDKDRAKINNLFGIDAFDDVVTLVKNNEVIILAVKPQDFDAVLSEIKDYTKDRLIVSIAAGITTKYIENILPNPRVIRAMPNVGAKIGKSVTCICKGSFAGESDMVIAKDIFKQIGEIQELPENMMNAATAISGSGPGYYFFAVALKRHEFNFDHKRFHIDFIAELRAAAETLGFDAKTALFLANWTVVYSDLLLKETKLSPEELRNQVTSKGGTTEAALEVLYKGGSLADAVKAAVKRAEDLSSRI